MASAAGTGPGEEEPDVTDKVLPLRAWRSVLLVNSEVNTHVQTHRFVIKRTFYLGYYGASIRKIHHSTIWKSDLLGFMSFWEVASVLTSSVTEESEFGVVCPKDAGTDSVQLVHLQSVISFGVLQQHHPVWKSNQSERIMSMVTQLIQWCTYWWRWLNWSCTLKASQTFEVPYKIKVVQIIFNILQKCHITNHFLICPDSFKAFMPHPWLLRL